MQIQHVTKEELALLINGLRSVIVYDQEALQRKLLKQLENELSQRFGLVLLERRHAGVCIIAIGADVDRTPHEIKLLVEVRSVELFRTLLQ